MNTYTSTQTESSEWSILEMCSQLKDAQVLYDILVLNGFCCLLVTDLHDEGDPTKLGFHNTGLETFQILVLSIHQEKARTTLELATKPDQTALDHDDYLNDFSNDELIGILKKPDLWSLMDYESASRLLKHRGQQINPETLMEWKQERLDHLAQPLQASLFLLVMGYILAIGGGLIGGLIGWQLTHHKRLLNGKQVPLYGETDQRHGRLILRLSIVGFFLSIILLLMLPD